MGPRTYVSRQTWLIVLALILAGVYVGVQSAFGSEPSERHPSRSPGEARQRQILQANIDQPGEPDLVSAYQAINARHFWSALPAMSVRWEPRLEEVGALEGRKYTLLGMFGRVGRRMIILLHPSLRGDRAALERALSHEMVHAHLFVNGNPETDHGPAFQAVLQRLASERAFAGLPTSAEDRDRARAWLDAESARLEQERTALDGLMAEIARERAEVERSVADLEARIAAANIAGRGWPSPADLDAVNARRESYNDRAALANQRSDRYRDALAEYNRQVERYNLMLAYPDGRDEA